MIQRFAAILLTLPVAAVLMAAPTQAQYFSSRPDTSRDAVAVERLPPPGANIDDNGDYVAQPSRAGQVPPVVTRGPQWLPGIRDSNERPLPSPGFAATGAQPAAAKDDPDVIRPPQPVGTAPQAATSPDTGTAALPPEDQPETGQPKELPPNLKRQLVEFATKEPAGTIVVDTANTYLYLVLGGGKAIRYGVRVGREGFTWTGTERISRMKEWPDWFPPPEMIERQPYLPRVMAGGAGNPLGARAMYLGHTLYRIHGTNQPSTIGHYVSSGCVGMLNEDVEDLYGRVQVGTRVVVLPGNPPPETASNGASAEAKETSASVMVEPSPTVTGTAGKPQSIAR